MIKKPMNKKNYYRIKYIFNNGTLLIGLSYSFIIFLLVHLFAYPSWEGADDFLISGILSGITGESSPYVLVISYPLSYILYLLQIYFPQLNWLTMVEIFAVWISFAIFIWIFLNKKTLEGYVIAFIVPFIFETLFYTSLNYTRSACLLAFTGLFTIYYCRFERPRKLGVGAGGLLFILASLIRYGCIFLAIPYVGIWIVKRGLEQIKERQFRMKENLTFILFLLGLFLVIFGLNYYHKYEYHKFSTQSDYVEFNNARAKAYDYLPQDYQIYQEQFEKIGFSYNDYQMLRGSMINDRIYDVDMYKKIATVNASENNTFEQKWEAVKNRMVNNLLYYNSGRQSRQYNIWFLFLCGTLLAMFSLGKKNIFSFACTVGGTIVIAFYFIWTGRFPPWIQDSLYFIGCINLLYGIEWKRAWLNKVHYRPKVQTTRKIAMYLMCFLTIGCGLNFSINKFLQQGKCTPNINVYAAFDYMEKEKDNIYLIDNFINCPYPIMDAYGSIHGLKRGSWSNIMRVGSWFIAHPVMNNQLETLNMESPISELVNENVYLFTDVGSQNLYKYQVFFYEHYDLSVVPKLVEQWGEYAIYSFEVVEQ